MNTKIPDPVELTQDLIRFNTINPPGNEDEICGFLEKLLVSVGFECKSVDFAPRRRSLIARIVGARGAPNICFTGHVDVVPLGGRTWQYEPFAAKIHEGKLY
ncbi:MAG: M20 family peptidase, partial [Burkholderiaceae bacterium]|nr:M20 family peptidase [Burkholderiaceae bacterium]